MPTVKMPNGDLVDMPDNPTPEQLQALQGVMRKQAQPADVMDGVKKFGSEAWDWAKNLGTAAYKGLADLPLGAAEAFAGSYDAQDALAARFSGKAPRELTPGVLTAQLNASGYQPKTKAQEVAQNVVRSAVGAAANPENILASAGATTGKAAAKALASQAVKASIVGASAGAGSEAAATVTDNPLARIAGGLAGGGAAGVAQAIKNRSNTGTLARQAIADVKPEDLDMAKQNMVDALGQGVPINLSQAMPQASNIDAIVDTLANNSHGTNVTKQLRDQPTQVSMGLEGKLADLPGDVHPSMQTPSNMVNDAATAVVQKAKDQRTEAFQSTLENETAAQQATADSALLAAKNREAILKARLEQAQQLEAAKVPAAPQTAVPTGVGATRDGILLDDAGRGRAALDAIASKDGQQGLEAGPSTIVGLDGKPLRPAPTPGSVEPFAADLDAARGDVRGAQANADSVGSVAPNAVQRLHADLTNAAADRPNTVLGARLTELRDKLVNPATGEFITEAGQLNNILKETSNSVNTPTLGTPGLDAGSANYLRGTVVKARNTLGEAFQPLQAANKAYQTATDEIVNPVKASVTGRLATPRGSLPDVEASTAKLQGLFDKGTNPGANKSEIVQLANDLSKVKDEAGMPIGSHAFQDSVKTWFANKLSKVQAPVDGRTTPAIAQRWVQMFGNGVQPTPASQGLRDMLAGVAKTQGVAASTYVKGMENFAKVIGMAANRPATVQGMSERALDAAASGSAVSVNNRVRTGPIGNLAARWNEALKADAYREMDRLLTSPEGVDMLKKLAAGDPVNPKMQAVVNSYLGTQADLQADNVGK